MQASVRLVDRVVMQVGSSLGTLAGCEVVDLTQRQVDDLRAAWDQPHGSIYLSTAGVVTFDPYVAPVLPPPDPQIAADKELVTTFMSVASGTATAAQRDDVTKAVIRYLRRSGNDA